MSLSKTIIKDMGYAKRSKVHAQKHDAKKEERKYAYPKMVCHMLTRHVEIKDGYPKKVCHMLLRRVKKREKIAHILKEKRRRERWFITWNSIHCPPKISTHSHILIKVYNSFLLGFCF